MTLRALAGPQRACRVACAKASEERDQDCEQHHSQFVPVTPAVSSSSCVEIMITAADFLVMPGIFWQHPACELIGLVRQPKNQRNNRTSNSVMKYTQPAIAISATLKNAPSNARSL